MPDPITPEKLAELRKLAEAATPGPWETKYGIQWEARVMAAGSEVADTGTESDAAHIAAFDPPTALALLDRTESLQARLDAWMAEADKWKDGCFDVARQRNELQERIDELQADIAENYVPKSWAGLMAHLDEIYPEDIFPTDEDNPARDAGPRIVSLIRQLDRVTRERDQLQARIDSLGGAQ